ncbi:MAG TPA: hypothetical protein VG755_40430 [Nannocystaceae bacterium]|nr:hypothetical protein [Nannocystaceae bacterium]
MKIFQLETIETDRRYCFVNPMIPCGGALSEGLPAAPDMTRLDLDVLDLQMDEDEGGLLLSDYVSNTDNLLVLRRGCADVIVTDFLVGGHEVLPARLINEKQRVHSDDYSILNPLGKVDCVDRQNSDMDKSANPWVNPWGKWYLRGSLVPTDRDLFRAQCVVGYFFSERLVAFIQAQAFTNLRFRPVAIS